MDVHEAIKNYEDALHDQAEMLQLYNMQRDTILKQVQPALEALEAEMRPYLQGYADQVEQAEAEARRLVLAQGETVNGEAVQFVYNKGKTTWDGQLLQGMSALLPELKQAMKTGQPGVSIRKKD